MYDDDDLHVVYAHEEVVLYTMMDFRQMNDQKNVN